MSTWTMTMKIGHEVIRRGDDAATTAQAWDAVHQAAAEFVRVGQLGPISLEVDGTRSTIHPAESGDPAADAEATLEVIESGRVALVEAHEAAHEAAE